MSQPSSDAVQHQQAKQQALTGLLAPALASAWSVIDLNDLPATMPKYELTIAALVRKFGLGSAKIAADFYQQQRTAAHIPGRFTPKLADPAGSDEVSRSVSWATRGLWTQPNDEPLTPSAEPELEEPESVPDHIQSAQTLVKGVTQKMVVDTGRNTLLEAIKADQKCRGWAREARPNACYFCAMLSTRGAVYKSEESASFLPHDNCHCIPVPVFADNYEPPAHVRQWQADYFQATKGTHGSKNAQVAWRRAYEGRTDPAQKKESVSV